jgi:hypothetical protein
VLADMSAIPREASTGPGDVTIRFGTHRGKRLREVPVSYLAWLLTIELREPLRSAVHDLVQELHRAAGGDAVEALFGVADARAK